MPFPCRPGTVPGTVQANCADQIRWSTTLAKHPSNHQSHFTQGDLPLAQGAPGSRWTCAKLGFEPVGSRGQGDLGGREACWTLACQPPGTVGVASTLAPGTGAGAEGCGFTREAQDREPAHLDGALMTPWP